MADLQTFTCGRKRLKTQKVKYLMHMLVSLLNCVSTYSSQNGHMWLATFTVILGQRSNLMLTLAIKTSH